jgi:hypothetical protein
MLRRYSLVRQAHHRGEGKGEAPALQETFPEASPLYQIVYLSRDDLQFQWEPRFQHHYGCCRDEALKTFDKYLNCGILAHGFGVSSVERSAQRCRSGILRRLPALAPYSLLSCGELV